MSFKDNEAVYLLETLSELVMIHERAGRQICRRKTQWSIVPSIEKHEWNRLIGFCHISLLGYAIGNTCDRLSGSGRPWVF